MKKVDTSAIKPTYFVTEALRARSSEKAEKAGITEEEQALYLLSSNAGFLVLKEKINETLNSLKELNKEAMSNGANFELIGQNAVILSMAEDVIKSAVLDPVQDAVELVEQNERR